MRETRMPPVRCPACDLLLDAASDPRGEAIPQPGDATLCIHCGFIGVFDDDLTIRRPTAAEQEEFAKDERIKAYEIARRTVQRRH